MRASFTGTLTRIYQKVSEFEGVKKVKLVAEILCIGTGSAASEVVTVTLDPSQTPDVPVGKVRCEANFAPWGMGGKNGMSVTSGLLESIK